MDCKKWIAIAISCAEYWPDFEDNSLVHEFYESVFVFNKTAPFYICWN